MATERWREGWRKRWSRDSRGGVRSERRIDMCSYKWAVEQETDEAFGCYLTQTLLFNCFPSSISLCLFEQFDREGKKQDTEGNTGEAVESQPHRVLGYTYSQYDLFFVLLMDHKPSSFLLLPDIKAFMCIFSLYSLPLFDSARPHSPPVSTRVLLTFNGNAALLSSLRAFWVQSKSAICCNFKQRRLLCCKDCIHR